MGIYILDVKNWSSVISQRKNEERRYLVTGRDKSYSVQSHKVALYYLSKNVHVVWLWIYKHYQF